MQVGKLDDTAAFTVCLYTCLQLHLFCFANEQYCQNSSQVTHVPHHMGLAGLQRKNCTTVLLGGKNIILYQAVVLGGCQ